MRKAVRCFLVLVFATLTSSVDYLMPCDIGYVYNGTDCIECGKTYASQNLRILGGVEAVKESWPAQLLVVMNYKSDYYLSAFNRQTISQRFICGGTLINRRTVLTAAHCIPTEFTATISGVEYSLSVSLNSYYPTWESMFTVYAGVHDITFLSKNQNPALPGAKLIVNKIVKYPSYDDFTFTGDLALLILQEPAPLSSAIQIACLPKQLSSSYPEPGAFEYSYASGWGSLQEGEAASSKLYNVRLQIYNSSYCSNVAALVKKQWSSQICSGQYNGSYDTCQGDSGGGLYVFDSTVNKFIVSGITSYGDGCGRYGKPGMYTRISFYADWIKSNWETINFQNTSNAYQSSNSVCISPPSVLMLISVFFLVSNQNI